MSININNYREWLSAFESGELNPAEENALWIFLEENPSLANFSLDDDFPKLDSPKYEFTAKDELLKSETNFDGMSDFDLLAVKSVEGCITPQEELQLKELMIRNPMLYSEMALFESTCLKPDFSLHFNGEHLLKSEPRRSFPFMAVLKYSAAAAVVGAALLFVWTDRKQSFDQVIAIQQKVEDVVPSKAMPATKKVDALIAAASPVIKNRVTPSVVKQIETSESNGLTVVSKFDETMLASKGVEGILPQYKITPQMAETNGDCAQPDIIANNLVYASVESVMSVQPKRKGLRLLERSVLMANLLGLKSVKFQKYYDDEGNLLAYQLKGDGFQWDQKIR